MNFPDTPETRATEQVMSELSAAQVLKPDDEDHPTNYGRAFEAVYRAMQRHYAQEWQR